jgi:hypothetical protein
VSTGKVQSVAGPLADYQQIFVHAQLWEPRDSAPSSADYQERLTTRDVLRLCCDGGALLKSDCAGGFRVGLIFPRRGERGGSFDKEFRSA